jgi:hypothetical protein
MPTTTVTTEIGQSLDIHGHFPSPVTLDDILVLYYFPDPVYIVTIQIITVHGEWKIYFFKNLSCRSQPNTMYIR